MDAKRGRKMKVSLEGLVYQAGNAAKRGDKQMGAYYQFALKELEQHIKDVVAGKHTIEEFADFYCIKDAPKEDGK